MTQTGQHLEQRRAQHAYKAVDEVKSGRSGNMNKGTYKSLANRLPGMIMTSGLLQTMAFLQADTKNNEKRKLQEHLSGWLIREGAPVFWGQQDGDAMQRLSRDSSMVLRQATREALAYAGWLKRWASALIEEQGNDAR